MDINFDYLRSLEQQETINASAEDRYAEKMIEEIIKADRANEERTRAIFTIFEKHGIRPGVALDILIDFAKVTGYVK